MTIGLPPPQETCRRCGRPLSDVRQLANNPLCKPCDTGKLLDPWHNVFSKRPPYKGKD